MPRPTFTIPTYLVPSIPFRRRSSTSTTSGTSSSSNNNSPVSTGSHGSGKESQVLRPTYLNGHASYLRCARCLTHICHTSQIVSKGFTGQHGRAYLVSAVDPTSTIAGKEKLRRETTLPNTLTDVPRRRQLVTGSHTVADLSCTICGTVLGWKYVAAEESDQRYKVGKFILETKCVVKSVCWEEDELDELNQRRDSSPFCGQSDFDSPTIESPLQDGIEFDSDDNDECEDLFLGVWSENSAKMRRRKKTRSMSTDL